MDSNLDKELYEKIIDNINNDSLDISSESGDNSDDSGIFSSSESISDFELFINSMGYGCEHYKRKCKIVAPCCNNIYWCRYCHEIDMNNKHCEDYHKLDKFSIKNVVCALCNEMQPVNQRCVYCDIEFGKYFCNICNLFDDNDKGQYHCETCNMCIEEDHKYNNE